LNERTTHALSREGELLALCWETSTRWRGTVNVERSPANESAGRP
jgi:hypothetical protein